MNENGVYWERGKASKRVLATSGKSVLILFVTRGYLVQ
jgi:hypothetical protein